MDSFNAGDLITISVVIQTAAGVDHDPPKLYFYYKDPAGGPAALQKGHIATPYSYGIDADLVHDSVGHYHIDLPVSIAGEWHYKWQSLEADNSVRGATTGDFYVLGDLF